MLRDREIWFSKFSTSRSGQLGIETLKVSTELEMADFVGKAWTAQADAKKGGKNATNVVATEPQQELTRIYNSLEYYPVDRHRVIMTPEVGHVIRLGAVVVPPRLEAGGQKMQVKEKCPLLLSNKKGLPEYFSTIVMSRDTGNPQNEA